MAITFEFQDMTKEEYKREKAAFDEYGLEFGSPKEFQEQRALIEDKMIKTQSVKEASPIEKYNIALTNFMRTLVADLGETYKRSNLTSSKYS